MRERLVEQATERVTHQNVRWRDLRSFENGSEFRNHVRHSTRCEPARAPAKSRAIVTHRARKFGNQRLHQRPA